MSLPITFKDEATGEIRTVNADPSYPVKFAVPSGTTEWKTEMTDPVHPVNRQDWVGNIPKPKN